MSHTTGEWVIMGRNINAKLPTGGHKTICIMGPENSYEMQANAAYICEAVNNHEKLLNALRRLCEITANSDIAFSPAYVTSKMLLRKLIKTTK